MSKPKDTEFDSSSWLEEVLAGAQLPDEQKEVLTQVLAQDTIKKNLQDSVMRRSDFSRRHDEVRTLEQDLKQKYKEAEDWLESQRQKDHNNLEVHRKLVLERDRLKQALTGSPITDDGDDDDDDGEGRKSPVDLSKYVSKDELTNFATQYSTQKDAEIAGYINRMLKLSEKYRTDFGKLLDVDEYIKFASENSLNLDQAYEPFTRELRDLKAQADLEDWKKTTRAEVEMEIRSKYNLPMSPAPEVIRPIDKLADNDLSDPNIRKKGAMKTLREMSLQGT